MKGREWKLPTPSSRRGGYHKTKDNDDAMAVGLPRNPQDVAKNAARSHPRWGLEDK